MENRPPGLHVSFSPLSEHNSSEFEPPPPNPTVSQQPRRRRFLSRLSRSNTDTPAMNTRGSSSFDLDARDFVSTRTPPKRKASASVRSGKSVLSTARSNSTAGNPPIVRAEHIFGPEPNHHSNPDLLDALGNNDVEVDSDDDVLFGLEMPAAAQVAVPAAVVAYANSGWANPPRDRVQEAFSVMRAHTTKTKESIQTHSAILFSHESSSLPEMFDDAARIRYLPLCPTPPFGRRDTIAKDMDLTILPAQRDCIDNATKHYGSSDLTWPVDMLPVELFNLITEYLSRDDLQSMRLVNREFEKKVSASLFYSSVVPFNTELYDMIDVDSKAAGFVLRPPNDKGKGRARDIPGAEPPQGGLQWQNAKDDAEGKVYRGHGLRVFQGFGPHIKRFGMSFEVSEAQLARPPIKKELNHVDAYHGSYDWPHEQYTRFANLAGLERAADETLRMKSAFTNLSIVQDLALSIDNGLGWLDGPDRSIHGRIFQQSSPVFGKNLTVPDQQLQDARAFWAAIQTSHSVLGIDPNSKELSLSRRTLAIHPAELPGLQGTQYSDTSLWPSISAGRAPPSSWTGSLRDMQYGVFFTTSSHSDTNASTARDKTELIPAELRKEQKEWLMETDWAQRAFLECYMLAIIDNPAIFSKIKTLTIAKLSSGLLPILARDSFWDALRGLSDVTIHVKPDWRMVEKDNAGFAEVYSRSPSEAVKTFYKCILRDQICLRSAITKLNIGWAEGGEHAQGIFARNSHLLPAPITDLSHSTAASANFSLVFKFVEHLTLFNCWITPPALEELVRIHASKTLATLTLDSVSLTAHPRFPVGGQAALQQQIAQAMTNANANANANANINVNVPPHVPAPQAPNLQGQQGWILNWHQFANNDQNVHNQQNQQQGAVIAQMQQMLQQAQALGLPNLPQQPFAQWPLPQLPLPPQNQGNLGGNGTNAGLPGTQLLVTPGLGAVPVQQQAVPTQALLPQLSTTSANPHWSQGHREGSWPEVVNSISPGTVFNDFGVQPEPWEEQLPERSLTSLRKIEFKSCGYAKLLNNASFDQFALEQGHDHQLSAWFRTRQAALTPAMMSTGDRYMARIVQYIPLSELNAMLFAWGFSEGWKDRAKADEAEYDGVLPGGTGRFSGVIEKGKAAAVPQ